MAEPSVPQARRRFFARPGCWLLGLLPVMLLLAAQVGFSPTTRWTVLRSDGAPVEGALVVFHYYGHRFNLVDSITYERSGGVVRSDGEGRVCLPWRLYRKGPLDTYARPWIDLLYAQELHFARGLRLRNVALPGVFEPRQDGREIVLHDLADDPVEWEKSLHELHRLVADLLYADPHRPAPARAPEPDALEHELTLAVRTEYEALLARHRQTPREAPPSSPYFESRPRQEQEEILARIRADLAREPLWGPVLERDWRRRIEQMEERLAARR